MDFDYRLPIQYGSTQPKIALIHSDEIALSKSAKLNKRESPVPVKSLAQCSSINVDYQVTLLLKQIVEHQLFPNNDTFLVIMESTSSIVAFFCCVTSKVTVQMKEM